MFLLLCRQSGKKEIGEGEMSMHIRLEQNSIQNTYTKGDWNTQAAEGEGVSDSNPPREQGGTLSSLAKGDVVNGTIQDIRNPYVVIEMENHNLVDALLTEKFSFNIGDKVIFQVKENTGGLLSLRPIMAKEQNEMIIQKALQAAQLPGTDRNKAIVTALVEQGMPIDKNSILELSMASRANPSIQLSTLVTMKQMELPLTPQNTAAFELWENGNLSLEKQVGQIFSHMYDTVMQTMENESMIQGLSLQEKIFSIILGEESSGTPNNNDIALSSPGETETTVTLNENGALKEQEHILLPRENESPGTNQEITAKNRPPEDSLWNQLAKAMGKSDVSAAQHSPHMSAANNDSTLSQLESGEMVQAEKTDLLTKEEILRYITDSSLDTKEEGNRQNLQLPTIKSFSREQLDAFREAFLQVLESPENVQQDKLKLLLSREDVKHLFLSAQKDIFCLKPELLEQSGEKLKEMMQAQYEKIRQVGMNMEHLMEQTGKESSMIKTANGDLQNQMQFLDNFSQNVTYMPIPVKFSSSQTEGDLYVWSNKKKKRSPQDALTAFLHFDLENLGATDIHIRLQDHRLSTQFQLEDKRSTKIVLEHLQELKERLEAKGFHVDCSALTQKEEQKIQQKILQEEKTPVIRRYNFDVRA